MDKMTRRSFLKPRAGVPSAIPALSGVSEATAAEGTNRRAFLQGTAGAAAGAAVILATPKVASIALDGAGSSVPAEPKAVVTKPSGPAPHEPVTAFVRNAERGEVTVRIRQQETTYKDPVLVEAPARRGPLTAEPSQSRKEGTDMSSHREAPEVSKDPVVDNTDTYAFVSPDNPSTVTIITNYLPAEVPAGGPTFYRVRQRRALQDSHRQQRRRIRRHRLRVHLRSRSSPTPNTFLYNTGPISSLEDPNWNKRQLYSGHAPGQQRRTRAGEGPAPARPATSARARRRNTRRSKRKRSTRCRVAQTVFAGQRNDPFFVDIGSIFDLADLRPIENLHLIPTPATLGVDTLETLNCHTIAIQVPISSLTSNGSVPTNVMSSKAVHRRVGLGAAGARCASPTAPTRERSEVGPLVQVSRLANPLFNEVLIPMARKDEWNAAAPARATEEFLQFVQHPELAKLLPVLYPKRVPASRSADRRHAKTSWRSC